MHYFIRIVLFFSFFFLNFSLLAQIQDTITANAAKIELAQLMNENRLEEAMTKIIAVETFYRQEGAAYLDELLSLQTNRTNIHFARGTVQKNLEESRDLFDFVQATGTEKAEHIASVNKKLADALLQSSQTKEAIKYYEKAVEVRRKNGEDKTFTLAYLLNNIATAVTYMNDYAGAIDIFKESISIFEYQAAAGNPDPLVSNPLMNLGNCYLATGDPLRGLPYLEKAAKYVDAELAKGTLAPRWIINKVQVNTVRASCHTFLKNYEKAKVYYTENEQLLRQVVPENHPFMSRLYGNMSELYRHTGELDLAIEIAEKAATINTNIGAQNIKEAVNATAMLAEVYMESGQFEKAIQPLQQCIAFTGRGLYEEGRGRARGRLAYTQAKLGDFENALLQLDSLKQDLDLPEDDLEALLANNSSYSGLRYYLANAQVYTLLFLDQKQVKYYELADKYWTKFSELFDYSVKKKAWGSTATIHSLMADSFEEAMLLYANLEDNTAEKITKTFELAERSRSFRLRENIMVGDAMLNAGLPKILSDDLKDVRLNSTYFQSQMEAAITDSLANIWRDSLFQNQKREEELQATLQANYPNYFSLHNETTVLDIATVQSYLVENEALITYYFGNGKLYMWLLLKTDNQLVSVDFDEKNYNDLKQFIQKVRKGNNDVALLQNSYQYYQQLIAPLEEKLTPSIQQLIFIPDDILNYLPFEILVKNEDAQTFKDAHYLLKDYAISYTYGGKIWQKQLQQNRPAAPELFGGFAPDYSNFQVATRDSLTRSPLYQLTRDAQFQLPGAKTEVEGIAALFDGEMYLGNAATVDNFKENAAHYQLLHLAMHAIADEINPNNTRLLFSQKNTVNELIISDLYNMQFQSDLTVLSACNTGYGKLQSGEGVTSLNHALTFAGVPATVTSLWSVPDQQTSKIMITFYENLQQNMPKDEALRQAKLKYIANVKNDVSAAPYFWAGFIASGNMQPISGGNSFNYWWVLAGFFLGVLVFFGGKIRTYFKR